MAQPLYSQYPKSIICNPRVTDSEGRLWCYYFLYAEKKSLKNTNSIKCLPPSQKKIAMELGWSEHKVYITHGSLRKKGYLRAKRGKEKINIIWLRIFPIKK